MEKTFREVVDWGSSSILNNVNATDPYSYNLTTCITITGIFGLIVTLVVLSRVPKVIPMSFFDKLRIIETTVNLTKASRSTLDYSYYRCIVHVKLENYWTMHETISNKFQAQIKNGYVPATGTY